LQIRIPLRRPLPTALVRTTLLREGETGKWVALKLLYP
jgi:hypothetical protein